MISFFHFYLHFYIVIILIITIILILLNKLHREKNRFLYDYDTVVYLFCTRALNRESFATQPTCFFLVCSARYIK